MKTIPLILVLIVATGVVSCGETSAPKVTRMEALGKVSFQLDDEAVRKFTKLFSSVDSGPVVARSEMRGISWATFWVGKKAYHWQGTAIYSFSKDQKSAHVRNFAALREMADAYSDRQGSSTALGPDFEQWQKILKKLPEL